MSNICKKCSELFTMDDTPKYIIEHFNRHLEEYQEEFESLEQSVNDAQDELKDVYNQLEKLE